MNEAKEFQRTDDPRLRLAFLSAVVACCLTSPSWGIDVLFTSPGTVVTLGIPYGDLEFDNPLQGDETVNGYAVLEWRDAGFTCSESPDYEDWSVSAECPGCSGGSCSINCAQGGCVDGYSNEIWLRDSDDSAATTTTVPSTVVSIHLHGDTNDGEVNILVDAVLVATLDMHTSPGSDRALVRVSNLADTTHTIVVDDTGTPFQDDIAIMGAAALEEALVPSVSEWGLIVMALLVLAAGTLVFTRRRPARA